VPLLRVIKTSVIKRKLSFCIRTRTSKGIILPASYAQTQASKSRTKNLAILDCTGSSKSARGVKLSNEDTIAAVEVFQHPGCATPKYAGVSA
jgi:hypothetical protein